MLLTTALFVLQVNGPELCLLTGRCALAPGQFGPASGWMFLAVGLVVIGFVGIARKAKAND